MSPLAVVHVIPVRVAESFSVVSIASVWVAPLWRFWLFRKSLVVLLFELVHELLRKNSDASGHREEVHSKSILDCKQANHNKYASKCLRVRIYPLDRYRGKLNCCHFNNI